MASRKETNERVRRSITFLIFVTEVNKVKIEEQITKMVPWLPKDIWYSLDRPWASHQSTGSGVIEIWSNTVTVSWEETVSEEEAG